MDRINAPGACAGDLDQDWVKLPSLRIAEGSEPKGKDLIQLAGKM